jgi:hypothetical protein
MTAQQPRRECFICGDPTDRDGVRHSEATGDGRTRAFVAIGAGERAPWEKLSLDCPTCGKGPLPLEDSVPAGLSFISHCGKSWMRGPITLGRDQ